MGEYPGKSLLKALPIQPLTRRRGRGHEESHELWGRLPAEQRRVHLGVSSPAPGAGGVGVDLGNKYSGPLLSQHQSPDSKCSDDATLS